MPGTKETHADQLRRRLEEEIVSGRLAPGTRLDESRLATLYGVSRTPVREALRQLSNTGLVVLRPRVGAVVVSPSLQEIIHMFEAMALLEASCGRLAARRMTPDERRALADRHAAMRPLVEAADTEAYHRANLPFHGLIYDGSHNPYLARQAMALHRLLTPYRAFQLQRAERLQASYEEHGRIVEAVVGGHEDAAAERLASHVELQGAAIGDLVSRIASFEMRAAG